MYLNFEEKIVVFTVYRELAQKAKKAIAKMGLSIDVVEISLENFVEKAEEYKKKGKEIVITRGGIADLLKKNNDLSVVKIKVSACDILNAMYKYRDMDKKIYILGDDLEIYENARAIGQVIGLEVSNLDFVNLDKITFSDIYERLDELIDDGMDTLIGMSMGDEALDYFTKKNVEYTVIKSEELSIIEAIENAKNLYKMTFMEREKKEKLQTILNFSSEGIISVDNEGKINSINPMAESILRVKESSVFGRHLEEIIPSLSIESTLRDKNIIKGSLVSTANMEIVVDTIPIIVEDDAHGAVISFRKTRELQELEQKIRYKLSQKGLVAKYTFDSIVGNSHQMKEIISLAKSYSKMSSTILLTGETGTGKEVFAQAIHNESNRKNNPFVAFNCSALPYNLIESELFGYCDGAFTGARKGGKQGLFELAHNGTIFLDEIGEMDSVLQSRLLRVIQEREVMRIGDDKVIPIDVRIIAATNEDLYENVKTGKFRLDLYFRLNVLDIHIPPIRERKEDIVELINALIYSINKKLNFKVKKFDDKIIKSLCEYHWPGNVRELQNVIEKIIVICKSGTANYEDVSYVLDKLHYDQAPIENEDIYNYTLEEMETKIILRVLEEENYNKTKAAQRLGINRNTLNRKLSKMKH